MKVQFLYNIENDDLFAYFPTEQWSTALGTNTCYSIIGEHSACHEDYAKESVPADDDQCAELLNVLTKVGYTNLQII